MKAPPLLFLGERRRHALQARMAAALSRWRQAWAPDSQDVFEATCDAPAAAGFTAPVASVATSGWELLIGGERVALLLLPHATFAWCVHQGGGSPMDGASAVAADSLGAQLEREVARSLLLEACAVEQREVASVVPAALGELAEWSRVARAWKLQAKSAMGRAVTLLIAAGRVEALLPARAPLPQTLVPAREAIGENIVALRAVVGETRIPVSELAGLALDDVLMLDQALTDPVTVVCGRAQVAVVAGNLGRAGARRAIKITGAAAPRS